MRHLLGNIATRAIAVLLLIGAVVFAWMRSAQVTMSNETQEVARFEPAGTTVADAKDFDWAELGELSYARNCQQCHLAEGQGWDQYPGLGHTSQLLAAPGGREYLIDVHIYGLTSDRHRAPMPPMGHMPDVEMAAVINYVLTSFGNEAHLPPSAQLYLPADVASQRGKGTKPAEVNKQRPQISN